MRQRAVLEVVAATIGAHFIYKLLKLVEPAGWNYSPGLTLIAVAVLFFVTHRRSDIEFGLLPPPPRVLLLMLAALAIPIAVAWMRGVSAASIGATVLARVVAAGIGEEFFFRGYAQARLDRAFKRPLRVLGANAGWGLVIAAALFGAVHACNPTQWYAGRLEFAWGWGLATFVSGLVFGYLRARTESVWIPAFAHGFSGVWRALLE